NVILSTASLDKNFPGTLINLVLANLRSPEIIATFTVDNVNASASVEAINAATLRARFRVFAVFKTLLELRLLKYRIEIKLTQLIHRTCEIPYQMVLLNHSLSNLPRFKQTHTPTQKLN